MQPVGTNPTTWYVRPYRPGDETQVATLYAEVFGRERPLEVWRWKLMEREISPASVWVAVTQDGEQVIGHYGGIPLHVRLRGEELPAVHAVEAMSSRKYRRQGILTALGSTAHEAWRQAGYAVVLGLPNEQWGTRNYALGYRRLFPLSWLRYPLHVQRMAARFDRLPAPLRKPVAALGGAGSAIWRKAHQVKMQRNIDRSGISVRETASPGDLDRLWSSLSGEYENIVRRDGAWVGWRFNRAAVYDYTVLLAYRGDEPSGYIAYRLASTEQRTNGYIADIFLRQDDVATASALVKAALDDLSARGAAMVMSTAAPGSSLYALLRRLGFLPTPRHTAFNFEIVPLQPSIELTALADPRTWHLTAGDFDVI